MLWLICVVVIIILDASNFQIQATKALKGHDSSVFAERTDDSSALQYFQVNFDTD